MRLPTALVLTLLFVLGSSGTARSGPDDTPAPGGSCTVRDNDVVLDWSGVIVIQIAIDRIVVERDGERIASPPPGETSYVDVDVPAVRHVYDVYGTVDWPMMDPMPGRPAVRFLHCEVVVPGTTIPGPRDLHCWVVQISRDGEPPAREDGTVIPVGRPFGGVILWWRNPIPYDRIVVSRDGERPDVLPGDQWYYGDAGVRPGRHVYEVAGIVDGHASRPARCEVRVPGEEPRPPYDLTCRVLCPLPATGEAPDPVTDPDIVPPCPGCPWPPCSVILTWQNGGRYTSIVIARDGEAIAKLHGWETRYVDASAPGGDHVYSVFGVVGEDPTAPARCKVTVPGPPVPPPPRELECVVRCVAIDCEPGNADCVPGIRCDVILTWQNGTTYGGIIITRDGRTVARLGGSAESWRDRPAPEGWHVYAVYGVVEGERPLPVSCRVRVPGGPLKPPFNLVCTTNLAVDPAGEVELPPDGLTGDAGVPDDRPVPWPLRGVYLRWENGSAYDAIRIDRDGETVARLPGFTERWVDWRVEPGLHTYAVFGVRGDEVTEPAVCEVEVPPPVPPPEELTCVVLDPSAIPGRTVKLAWTNPVDYDKLLLYRNGMQVQELEGSPTEATDLVPGMGRYVYLLVGVIGSGRSAPARCEVIVEGPVPPVEDLTCLVLWAEPGADGDPDAAGGPIVVLRWKNPVRYDEIFLHRERGEPVVLPGSATHYSERGLKPDTYAYHVVGRIGDHRSDPASCTVDVPGEPLEPPQDLACAVEEQTVTLTWTNPTTYDQILVCRDNLRCVSLPGDATSYADENVPAGRHGYRVIGVAGGSYSPPATCTVVVIGPPERDLLYFLPGVWPREPAGDAATPLPPPDGTATALADNVDPIQGWSFGICSDPTEITPEEAALSADAQALNGGAGPGFVYVNLYDEGVTMAAVVAKPPKGDGSAGDGSAGDEVLPPGRAHELLVVRYAEVGTSAVSSGQYRVDYCDTLGEPPVAVLFVVEGFERRPKTIGGVVRFPPVRFIRGDGNADGAIDLADAVFILQYMFAGGPKPSCLEAANANGGRQLNLADPIYLLSYLFSGGPEPPAPFPDCEPDPSGAPLGCEAYTCPEVPAP